MKKIGFIDYYLDEWHANHYPHMIDELSDGAYKVCCAYGKINAKDGITNREWAEKLNVQLLDTIEDVIEKSDYIVVLSPDNPEMHEELADLPLKSGKLVYIDKIFAPTKAAAERMYAKAERYGTKCYSTSAVRFAEEVTAIDKKNIGAIYGHGSGSYDTYSIHQIEPIICLMEASVKRIMALADKKFPSILMEFEDGRHAQMYQAWDAPFAFAIADRRNSFKEVRIESDFFVPFIRAMLDFFESGEAPVTTVQTIHVMAIIEAGAKALKTPFKWIELV